MADGHPANGAGPMGRRQRIAGAVTPLLGRGARVPRGAEEALRGGSGAKPRERLGNLWPLTVT
ncbi:hypothetical protein GCM10010510_36810 [Streptomyces anandii JCM 4720]|nr:hypothetical protein GCM10010510_36810 [Streptomyces anandii JCM 4720]